MTEEDGDTLAKLCSILDLDLDFNILQNSKQLDDNGEATPALKYVFNGIIDKISG